MNAKMVKGLKKVFGRKKMKPHQRRAANRATTPDSIKRLLYGEPQMSKGERGRLRRYRARRRRLLKITKQSRRTNR